MRAYWYRGAKSNFGDELKPFLMRRIARLPSDVVISTPPAHPKYVNELVLLGVGSILRLSHRNTVCWDAGIRNIDQKVARQTDFALCTDR